MKQHRIMSCLAIAATMALAAPAHAIAPEIGAALIGAVAKLGPLAYKTIEDYNRTNNRLRSVNDALIFFEDNNCGNNKNSNMVGSLPLDRDRDTFAKEVPWFRNDEARSVLIWNANKVDYAPKAGSVVTLYDSPDRDLKDRLNDDFVVIQILRDFPKDHGICIGSFEDTFQDSAGYVRMVFHRNNGLDGKVSAITSSPNDAAGAYPPDLLFYEGNNCTQSVKARLSSRRNHDENCKSGGACSNDDIKSMRVPAYAKPGTMVRVYDDPDGKTKDDWAEVKVQRINTTSKTDFEQGTCIGTFEKDRGGEYISVNYHKNNHLDGKISRIRVNR